MCSKGKLGKELSMMLNNHYSIIRISNWSFDAYENHCRELTPELENIIKRLSFMEIGPQFEYSCDELQQLAKKLIEEGEKEELCDPIPGIKDRASDLGYNWLMCSICQEAWEDHSTYGMVRCPKCNSKLHNPKYNKKNE
jgi:hypothetical protein